MRSEYYKESRARRKKVIALIRRLRAGEITKDGYLKGVIDIFGPEMIRCITQYPVMFSRTSKK